PDPRPPAAAARDPRARSEGEGVKGVLIAAAVVAALFLANGLLTGSLVPGVSISPYFVQILCLAGINVILAVSLNLTSGFTGQFSIGHAGFMAVGAYTSAYLAVYHAQVWERSLAAVVGGGISHFLIFLILIFVGGLGAAIAGLVV